MKLIAISPHHLRLNRVLPFGVRDAFGRLLLNPGATIRNDVELQYLLAQPLWADEGESTEWRRKLGANVDPPVRSNATFTSLANAQPASAARDSAKTAADISLSDQWEGLALLLDSALRDAARAADWLARVHTVRERAQGLARRWPDGSLYHLIHNAGHSPLKYSCHHALLSFLVCDQAAALLGWDGSARHSLAGAALTMNLSMAALQDQLAQSELQPTPAMREQIRDHAQASATLLRESAVGDERWCRIVQLHHDHVDLHRPLTELDDCRQMARLLRRADIFTAKISRRRTRAPVLPVQAARQACLGADGVPDEIGCALLRATGLYPPGSFVELVDGERGIVIARGRCANRPWVASLVAPSGMALGEPALRDTLDARHAVRAAVNSAALKVRPDHTRILALR